jgi:hypothetical protein
MPDAIPITDEHAQRRIDMRDAWDRYDGQHPDSLTLGEGQQNDNVALNNLATIVDTGADFLLGSGSGDVEIAVMIGEDEDEDATEYLNAVLERNRKRTLLRNMATDGAIAGHFAFKIIPTDDAKGLHRIVLIDPLELVIQSDESDIDERIGYAIDTTIWDDTGSRALGRRREQHTRDEAGQSWTVQWLVTDTPIDVPGVRVQWMPDPKRPEPETWPHAFAAIVDGQNLPAPHREWGRSDLTPDILHMQEAINRVASNEQKTLRHFAHPQVWAQGDDPTKLKGFIDASIGAAICLPSGASLNTLNVQHQGLALASQFRDSLTDKLFEVARTPRIAAGKVDGIGSLSGVALLILYRPLIAKTQTKRDCYGDVLREVCDRVLRVSGRTDESLRVEVSWPEVLPRDDASEILQARDLKDVGVSMQTILERLGIPYQQEMDRIREEASEPMTDQHGLLSRLDEMQALLDARDTTPIPASEDTL